jgi:hypothetical protein
MEASEHTMTSTATQPELRPAASSHPRRPHRRSFAGRRRGDELMIWSQKAAIARGPRTFAQRFDDRVDAVPDDANAVGRAPRD